MLSGQPPDRRFRTVALVCASLPVVLGLMTFIGWMSGLPLLASVRAKYIPMAPSTAFGFSLIGCGLLLQILRPQWRWISRVLAALVVVMAGAKVVEIFGGYRFGIDAWFVRNPELFDGVPTGRMAPLTAFTFIFTALSLLALSGKKFSPAGGISAGPLGALVVGISTVILVGYWYGTPLLYGGTIIPVALPTAIGFFLCGVAVMLAAGRDGWPLRTFLGDSARSLLLRAFLPVIVGMALLNGWVNATLLSSVRTNPAVISALGALVFAVLITWIILQVSRIVGGRIDAAEKARNLAQAELLALNTELETRVADRTRELSTKNQQMHEELVMARELQTALLPQQFPTVPPNVPAQESALGFVSLYFPTGDVSGDFFSIFPVGENAAGVFICDVMGHGVRSALITSMIRGLVEEHARSTADPGELLSRVNHGLTVILKQAGTTMFATCLYVVADVQQGQLRYANAGHPCALHIRRGQSSPEKLAGEGRSGPAMGIFPSASYTTHSKSMAEGDLVMLFTDGLFEVEDLAGELFSEAQLQATVSRHAALAPDEFFKQVLGDIRTFSQRESFDDDVCVVGMQVQHMAGSTSVAGRS